MPRKQSKSMKKRKTRKSPSRSRKGGFMSGLVSHAHKLATPVALVAAREIMRGQQSRNMVNKVTAPVTGLVRDTVGTVTNLGKNTVGALKTGKLLMPVTGFVEDASGTVRKAVRRTANIVKTKKNKKGGARTRAKSAKSKKRKAVQRSNYRRLTKSPCRKKGPAACRGTKGCNYASGKKRSFCRKGKNSGRRKK